MGNPPTKSTVRILTTLTTLDGTITAILTQRIISQCETPGDLAGRYTAKCFKDKDPKMLRWHTTPKTFGDG